MSTPIPYQRRSFWSVVLSAQAERISVPDANSDEHYAVVPMDGTGKQNRERRKQVLEQLAQHVEEGKPPGEVEVRL